MRRFTASGLALAALTVTACSGPTAPLDVGTQAAPVDLVLGEHKAVVEAPVGPLSLALPTSLAPYRQLPSGGPSSPRLPALQQEEDLGPCPDFDPLSPVMATGVVLPGPPAPATYTYRASTSDIVGKLESKFSGDTTWKVTVGRPDENGGYEVTLEVTIGNTKSTRVLLVQPTPIATGGQSTPLDAQDTADPNVQAIDQYNATVRPYGLPLIPRAAPNYGRYGPAGIYLVSQTSGDGTFTPTVPIPLVQTPIAIGAILTGYGSDGVTAMNFTSTVTKVAPVNACGTKLESIQVDLTDGRIAGLSEDGKVQQVDFSQTLYFGLQFGGLPLRDTGKVSSASPTGDTIQRTFDFTVNTKPKAARG